MLVKELTGWPGVVGLAGGGDFPRGGEGVLNGVFPARDNHVTFSCIFENRELRYHLDVDSTEHAESLSGLLSRNFGRTVAELGELRVD